MLLSGLWRVSRERFLLMAALAQGLFALHQTPLFVDSSVFASPWWRGTFAAIFGLYMGLSVLVVNLLCAPPRRWLWRLNKLYLWLIVPVCYFIFSGHDVTGFVSKSYVHHRLTANNLLALLANVGLAWVVVRRFHLMQQQLLQTRMDASFAAERAKLTERQRIMSDIHDSVGSQLVGVLSLIRSGAPKEQLELHTAEALQDLRLAVDAIQPVNGNFAAVLATLRHRLQPRLDAAGLELIWHVDDLPRMADLSPQKIQHIQRIVLEAFSNIIQYASATKVLVRAQAVTTPTDKALIRIRIADNGVGFSTAQQAGQGLANMQLRARMMGAALTCRSAARSWPLACQLNLTGTSLRLDLPFTPPSPT
jgi:signal transduction histidine kinase